MRVRLGRLLLWGMLGLLVPVSEAGQLTLQWDPPETSEDGTPLTDLAGYYAYYGKGPGDYPNRRDVGNVTEYTWTGLPEGIQLYFVVTAYDRELNESQPSNEASGMVRPDEPPPPPPPPPVSCAEDPVAFVQASLPVVPVAAQVSLYSDRSTPRLNAVPAVLAGACLVQTRAADNNSKVTAQVQITLHKAGTVFLGYDQRITTLPTWLQQQYDATGIQLRLSAAKAKMRLWSRVVPAGSTLTLPGNCYQRRRCGGLSYTIWIQGEQT